MLRHLQKFLNNFVPVTDPILLGLHIYVRLSLLNAYTYFITGSLVW